MNILNEQILIFLNSLLEYDSIKIFVNIFADGPIFFLPIFLVVMWLYASYGRKRTKTSKEDLLLIFYSTVLAISFNTIFQKIFHFTRPDEICKLTGELILNKIPEASFPSDHAAVSFAFVTGLFLAGYKKTGIIFSLFVILMNIARIMACVHWPLDILIGAIFGIFWAYITFSYISKLEFIKRLNTFIIETLKKIKL